MSESNLTQNTNEGEVIFINEISGLNGSVLGRRNFNVVSKNSVGDNVVFTLEAAPNDPNATEPHEYGDREAIVDSMNMITTRVIMNGRPQGLESRYNVPDNYDPDPNTDLGNLAPQGGKKKRKTLKKRKSIKKRKTKRKKTKRKSYKKTKH